MKIANLIIFALAVFSINSTLFTRLRRDLYEPINFGLEKQYPLKKSTISSYPEYFVPQYEKLRYRGYQGYPRAFNSHNNVNRFDFNGYKYNLGYHW
jgi:hypothetical protein